MIAFACLLTVLSFTNLSPELIVEVAKGTESEFPQNYVPLSELDQLQIKQAYWARIGISNTYDGTFILQGGKPNLNKILFYSENRSLLQTGNNLEIVLDGRDTTFYLFYPFVDDKDSNLLSVSINEKSIFLENSKNESIGQYVFHSFLLFPLLVSIIFYLRTFTIVYLHYALYILSIICFFSYQYGILATYIPAVNKIPPIWIWLCGSVMSILYLLFTISFLDLKKTDPFSRKLILIAIWFTNFYTFLSISLYALGIDVQHSISYKIPFLSVQIILIFWFIGRTFGHPSNIKYYYLTSFFILFAIAISGQILSASRSATDYNHLYQVCLVAEVFVLTLGLSARVNATQKEKDIAQNRLIEQLKVNEELQNEYTEELENKVIRRTESLDLRNKENEMLLKEVHHRVKNNLQMITSMINMYNRRSDSEKVEEILVETRNKIKTMALIHEHLYSHENFSKVALNEYLGQLIKMIISSLHKGKNIDLRIAIDNVVSDIQTSISLGLILNELVTNSLKYALMDHPSPSLTVEIKEEQEMLLFKVEDNGQKATEVTKDGLGYTIIRSILDTMEGSIVQTPSNEGFKVEINLNDY